MRATVFVGVSLDGFLARPNHDLDWLPDDPGEDHGYTEFYESVDAVVIGRNTYDKVLTFGQWPYGSKRVFVLTTRPLGAVPDGANLEELRGEPSEIAAALDARGVQHAYIDGGIVIQRFLRAGLVQRLVITRVPVLIGAGIPLFGAVEHDIPLRHIATRALASGLVQSEYEVIEG